MASRIEKQFRLKELQKIIPKLEKEVNKAKELSSINKSALAKLRNEQAQIITSLTNTKKEVVVSDHALIRYLERKYGFDFEQYRNEILTPVARQAIQAGADCIKVGGISFKVANNTIITAV